MEHLKFDSFFVGFGGKWNSVNFFHMISLNILPNNLIIEIIKFSHKEM